MKQLVLNNKREMRKDANIIGITLLLYTIISFGIIMIDAIIKVAGVFLQTTDEAQQQILFDAMINEMVKYGTSSIVGVVAGVLFLVVWNLCTKKRITIKSICVSRKKMTLKTFFQILCVFMAGQAVFSFGFEILEKGLNLIGYTAIVEMESASSASETISMFLYAGIIGPIAEELVYRGFVLKRLEVHGKLLAIIVSSILFGVMHCNLPQSIFACCVGFVLAYVAVEYSIVWSILLHIVNNCLFGDVYSMAVLGLSEQMQTILDYGIIGGFFIAGMIVMWKKRKSIKQYFADNKLEKKSLLYVMTRIGMVIFIVVELLVALDGLERI